jgi:hypothetical protein
MMQLPNLLDQGVNLNMHVRSLAKMIMEIHATRKCG